MAIESFDEVKSYFETNKDNDEVSNYVKGFLSLDGVKGFLENNEDGKNYINSFADTKVSKGIETFKQNNLSKLVEDEMKKLNPQLDPKDIKFQELQNKFEALEKEKVRETLTNKALKLATEKKLPVDIISYFLGDSEESTVNNLTALEKTLQAYTQSVRESILNDGSYTPPTGDKSQLGTITQADWDRNKNDLDWYEKNKAKIFESKKKGLIK